MTFDSAGNRWQQIGWNSVAFRVPPTWQPTVIYPSYIFFEDRGKPVFEIKWQQIDGPFSVEKTMASVKKTLPKDTRLEQVDLPPELAQCNPQYSVFGFQIDQATSNSNGILFFCPDCHRIILAQWYFETAANLELLTRIFRSLNDHVNKDCHDTLWSVYDIETWLPADAALLQHEFLPGKYELSFKYKGATLTLYRFKPASVILGNASLGTFGSKLLDIPPREEEKTWACWRHQAFGLALLLAKLRRKPVWSWMRLWHDPDQNVILGVKAEGKRQVETGWLEQICQKFISVSNG